MYASIVLDLALDKPLDYAIPENLQGQVKKGMRVEVPVRGFPRQGYVLTLKDQSDYPKVLPIRKILSPIEFLTEDLFELAFWMARYYHSSLSKVLKVMFPSSIRKDLKEKEQLFIMRNMTLDTMKQLCMDIRKKYPSRAAVLDVMLKVEKGILLTKLLEETGGTRSPVESLIKEKILLKDIVRVDRSSLTGEEYFQTQPKTLYASQKKALDAILESQGFAVHLLHGITGSGKTEVYLQAIDTCLREGKSALMLVPEISLTAQTIERFRSRFPQDIAVLHHRLSEGERRDAWHNIREGSARIVIGARSAIFCPAQNLGLIIIDEEHENSYKQSEESPYYHARDVAVMRGKIAMCPVVLGSATPSLESYTNAKKGKYILSTLDTRAENATLPTVTIVDMKREYEKAKGYTTFSDPLLTGIKKRVELGEQTILFLNRRGYHTTLFCKECGEGVKCRHCEVALTFHKDHNHLSCHLCGYSISPPPKICPTCKYPDPMKFRGVGTEQVERALHAIFPNIRTLRVDADTTRHKGSHQKLLKSFGSGKADVLIGTQMVTKGLHFPGVTLVGILNTDGSLNIPDFRASETVFQLITQVSGRAGRGALAGEVILQTCLPDNSTILYASKQDYVKFYEEEITTREMFHYPPFTRMAKFLFTGSDPKQTEESAQHFFNQLRQKLPPSYELNPVVPSGYAKIKDRFRFQFLVRGPSIYPLNQVLGSLAPPKACKLAIDIDPTSTYF